MSTSMPKVGVYPDLKRAPRTDAARSCELCGGTNFEIVGQKDRHGLPLETAICRRCGMVSHMRIPSDAELAEYYAKQYRRDYHGENGPSAKRVMRAWKNGQRILTELQPHLSGNETILEVGAGIGCTVRVFQEAGYEAAGIEPGEGFQDYSRKRLGANVERAGLFELDVRSCYDAVLLVHVIEHFNSPTRALLAIHRLLKPNGLLYLECPNLAAPFAVRGRLFHFAHVYNFTPWTLLGLAAKCGFRLEAQLSRDYDPNLQILLRRVDSSRQDADPEGYRRTIERINRYNVLTYHLRAGYIAKRLHKLSGYLREKLTAHRFVRRLCNNSQ